MAVRLFWDNRKFDQATLTPSSQSQNLPATNVQNNFRTRVWRTGNTLATETLTIDMGAPVTVDACILFFTDLDTQTSPVDSAVKLLGNSSNSFSSPPFSESLTQASITDSSPAKNYFFGYFNTSPGPPTYRYWQVAFTKSSASETRDIGRIFLGTTYDFIVNPQASGGVDIELADASNKTKGVGLNTYVETLPQFKNINLAFTPMAQSGVDDVDAIFYYLGQKYSFFVQVDQTGSYDEIYFAKLASTHRRKVNLVTQTTQYWDLSYVFEEQL